MQEDDGVWRVHHAIDWTRCVVGGSYALKKYLESLGTGPVDWSPNDVDIPCRASSHEEFWALVDQFTGKIGRAQIVDARVKLLSEEDRKQASRDAAATGREERFHHSILATATLRVTGVAVPVQLVGLQVEPTARALVDHLNETTDLPACVSYTAQEDVIFHVPRRGVKALATRHVRRLDTCRARVDKYKARGFVFDE